MTTTGADRVATAPLSEDSRGLPSSVAEFLGRYGTISALILMVVGFGAASPEAFFNYRNFLNVLNQGALLAIIAGGLTFPLVAGQFDLSFAAVASLAGILTMGLMTNQGLPWGLACLVVVGVGAVIGLVNGLIVTVLRVNAIVTTLGMATVILGLNYLYSNGIPIPLGAQAKGSIFVQLGQGRTLGIPNPVFFMLVVLVVLWVMLNRMRLGHYTKAVGSNASAAALSGVRVGRITTISFVVAGFCAALAGILLSARIGSGQVTAGEGFLLSAFAAVFLGAAVLRDGEFHIIGTLVGVFIVTIGFNGLSILGAPSHTQFFFQGGILIVATALSTTTRRFVRVD
jgi:ribose transport system permease protein